MQKTLPKNLISTTKDSFCIDCPSDIALAAVDQLDR